MDTPAAEQLMCVECSHVHAGMLASGRQHDAAGTCPRCGADAGASVSIECLYDAAQAVLIRF